MIHAPADWLIVPGRSIGHVEIGPNVSSLAILGKVKYGDAAMQKSWSTWIGASGGRIDVYQANDEAGTQREQRRIHIIRATSSRFHLANGLHPGSPGAKMRATYFRAKPSGSYASPSGRVSIWDDVKRGLGWEVAPNGRVLAMIVHDEGIAYAGTVKGYVAYPLHRS